VILGVVVMVMMLVVVPTGCEDRACTYQKQKGGDD